MATARLQSDGSNALKAEELVWGKSRSDQQKPGKGHLREVTEDFALEDTAGPRGKRQSFVLSWLRISMKKFANGRRCIVSVFSQ
jgi:hypothetical protein